MKISYTGCIGQQNIGDEAILVANKRLFDGAEFRFPRFEDTADSDMTLVGGGTVLPYALMDENSYTVENSPKNYCLGVGVSDPDYYNSCLSNRDLQWYLDNHMSAVDIPDVVSTGARKLNTLLNAFGYDPFLLASRRYYTDEDYELVGDFGFDDISVRGPRSRRTLLRYGIDADIVGDPALFLEPSEYHRTATGKIAINIRADGKRWMSGPDYVDEIISFCCSISDEYSFVILPFQPSDMDVAVELTSEIPNAELKDYSDSVNIDGVLDEIATADAMIGERLHSSILAATCYTPFISVEYIPKCADFTDSINLPELSIRTTHVTEEKIDRLFSHIMSNRGDITETLERNVGKYRSRLLQKKIEFETVGTPDGDPISTSPADTDARVIETPDSSSSSD